MWKFRSLWQLSLGYRLIFLLIHIATLMLASKNSDWGPPGLEIITIFNSVVLSVYLGLAIVVYTVKDKHASGRYIGVCLHFYG